MKWWLDSLALLRQSWSLFLAGWRSGLSSALTRLRMIPKPTPKPSGNMETLSTISSAPSSPFTGKLSRKPSRQYLMIRAVFMSLLIVFCFMLVLAKDPQVVHPVDEIKYPVFRFNNLYVATELDDYAYIFQKPDGTRFKGNFCHDYEPQFSAGQTLITLQYEDRGQCWSLLNMHPGYIIKRGYDGNPIIETQETARIRS